MRKILDLITKAIILSPLVSFCYGDNNVVFEMRSQCHEPLTSDCTDNNACCINATDYYENFFKGILVKQGVSEPIIHPNITENLFQSLLNFTQNKTDDLFEQEDQDKLSKSCLDEDNLPLPYEIPNLAEINYAYLFHLCEKGFEFAESLAPITGASELIPIDVASSRTLEDLNSDIFVKITAYIEENLPAIPELNETQYKVDVQFQDESDGCKEIVKSRFVPFDEQAKMMEGSVKNYKCNLGISYTITIIQNVSVFPDIKSIDKEEYETDVSTFVNDLLRNKEKIGKILKPDTIIIVEVGRLDPTPAILISASAGLLLIAAFISRQSNKPVAAVSSRRIEIVFPVPSLPEVQEKIQKEEEILLPTGNA